VWQPPPILEEVVAASRQDPETFGLPVTSDTEYQRQAPTVQMNNTSVVSGSSFHSRMTVQNDRNFREGFRILLNEVNTFLTEFD